MPRKRRKDINGEAKKPTRYDDAAALWIRKIAEEVEELADAVPREQRWQTPKYVHLQFSEKDAEKEECRNVWKRKAQRAGTRR